MPIRPAPKWTLLHFPHVFASEQVVQSTGGQARARVRLAGKVRRRSAELRAARQAFGQDGGRGPAALPAPGQPRIVVVSTVGRGPAVQFDRFQTKAVQPQADVAVRRTAAVGRAPGTARCRPWCPGRLRTEHAIVENLAILVDFPKPSRGGRRPVSASRR